MPRAKDDIDEALERAGDALRGVTPDDVLDAALKTGTWASCVIGAKIFLDTIPLEDMLKLAAEPGRQDQLETLFRGGLITQLTGSPALAAIPLIQEIMAEDKDKLLSLAIDSGIIYSWTATLNPYLLPLLVIRNPDRIKSLLTRKQSELEALRGQLASIEAAMDELSAELQNPMISEDRRTYITRQLNVLGAQRQKAIKAIEVASDSNEQYDAARKATANKVRWAFALIVGTYVAASLIYAGDTILDVMKEAFAAFKLPVVI